MVDLAMMTKLLDDIYAALPKKEVKELLAGIARFNSQRKTRWGKVESFGIRSVRQGGDRGCAATDH